MPSHLLVGGVVANSSYYRMMFLLLFLMLSPGCGQPAPEGGTPKSPIALDEAVHYDVIQQEDTSSRTRKRMSAFIYSPAQTIDERVQTSFKAALELQAQGGSKYVKIIHLISPDPEQVGLGTYLAVVSYAPDGLGVNGSTPLRHGVWEADVTDQVGRRDIKGSREALVGESRPLPDIRWVRRFGDRRSSDEEIRRDGARHRRGAGEACFGVVAAVSGELYPLAVIRLPGLPVTSPRPFAYPSATF